MDDADRANALTDFQVDLRLAAIRRENAEARAQTSATMRICDDCADPIEPERLAAKHGARRCVHCQTAAERSAKAHRTGARA